MENIGFKIPEVGDLYKLHDLRFHDDDKLCIILEVKRSDIGDFVYRTEIIKAKIFWLRSGVVSNNEYRIESFHYLFGLLSR